MKYLITLPTLALLAACGGSSPTFTRPPPPPPPEGIDLLRGKIERLQDSFMGTSVTPFAEISTPGGAVYEGALVAGFLTDSLNGIGFGGDLEMEVTLNTMELTGSVDNFFNRDGDSLAGRLTLANGVASPFGGFTLLTAELTGELEIFSQSSNIGGSIAGSLGGESGEFASGQTEVVVLDDAGLATPISFEGGFLAERQ